MAFKYFAEEYYAFSEVSENLKCLISSCINDDHKCWAITLGIEYSATDCSLVLGSSILHNLSVGDTICFLCIPVCWGECSSIHNAARRSVLQF